MASGFMTLPVPILGNTYAMVKTSGGNENTLNQRGTPAIYWASLWNRCLAIVDNHDHNSGDTSQYGDQGSTLGKPLNWGSPLNSGTGGILVSHDFDLFQGPELIPLTLEGILNQLEHYGFQHLSEAVGSEEPWIEME